MCQKKEMTIAEAKIMERSIIEVEKYLRIGILSPENAGHPFLKPTFLIVLINIRSLIAGLDLIDQKLAWYDDVIKDAGVKDISSLIIYFRDVMCHPESWRHNIEGHTYTFNISIGARATGVRGARHECDYEGEIAFCYGRQKLYLNRHLIRSFLEIRDMILSHLESIDSYVISPSIQRQL